MILVYLERDALPGKDCAINNVRGEGALQAMLAIIFFCLCSLLPDQLSSSAPVFVCWTVIDLRGQGKLMEGPYCTFDAHTAVFFMPLCI
jgi:hypothetical protein